MLRTGDDARDLAIFASHTASYYTSLVFYITAAIWSRSLTRQISAGRGYGYLVQCHRPVLGDRRLLRLLRVLVDAQLLREVPGQQPSGCDRVFDGLQEMEKQKKSINTKYNIIYNRENDTNRSRKSRNATANGRTRRPGREQGQGRQRRRDVIMVISNRRRDNIITTHTN